MYVQFSHLVAIANTGQVIPQTCLALAGIQQSDESVMRASC
jgi:hypothetical protein